MPRLPLFLLAVSVAAPAFAQTSTPTARNPWLRDETRADAEARAAAMFARMDLDHDGFVTLAEISAFAAARAPRPAKGKLPATPPIAREMFDDADADHDGRISAEESKAAADRGFDEADIDHDGLVTPAERMAATQDVIKDGAAKKAKPPESGR